VHKARSKNQWFTYCSVVWKNLTSLDKSEIRKVIAVQVTRIEVYIDLFR